MTSDLIHSSSEKNIDRFAEVRDFPIPDSEATLTKHSDISISERVSLHRLPAHEIDPIVDRSVQSLGNISLVGLRETSSNQLASSPSRHRLYAIENNGYKFAVEITDPIDNQAALTIISFPGFTETIEGGFRTRFQEQLHYQFPNARIVSVGSNGVGSTGDRYGWNERSLHGFEDMAEQRLALVKALSGQAMIFGEGTSMGSVVLHHFAKKNIKLPSSEAVNLAGLVYLSPALVDPKNVLRSMLIQLPRQLTVDAFIEIGLKTPVSEMQFIFSAIKRYGLNFRDVNCLIHQGLELLKGTNENEVESVISTYPTVVIAGEKDPLAQIPMWQRIAHNQPANVSLEIIQGRGHILPMKPEKANAKMRKASEFLIRRLDS